MTFFPEDVKLTLFRVLKTKRHLGEYYLINITWRGKDILQINIIKKSLCCIMIKTSIFPEISGLILQTRDGQN